jgi:hypothetical protein
LGKHCALKAWVWKTRRKTIEVENDGALQGKRTRAWRKVFARYGIPGREVYLGRPIAKLPPLRLRPWLWELMAERLADEFLPEFRDIRLTVPMPFNFEAEMAFDAIDLLMAHGMKLSEAVAHLFDHEHRQHYAAVRKAYERHKRRLDMREGNVQHSTRR